MRLIGEAGEQLGIVPTPAALSLARDRDLDLVEIAPMATPPVCKLLDYAKWRYDEAQREKEARRRTTHTVIKEMKYRPKIGGGDFETKTRTVRRFLEEGHKVKITIMFRGREVAHPELGMKILERIQEEMGPLAKIEAVPRLDGRNMTMVLAPEKKVLTKAEKLDQVERDKSEGISGDAASVEGSGGEASESPVSASDSAEATEAAAN